MIKFDSREEMKRTGERFSEYFNYFGDKPYVYLNKVKITKLMQQLPVDVRRVNTYIRHLGEEYTAGRLPDLTNRNNMLYYLRYYRGITYQICKSDSERKLVKLYHVSGDKRKGINMSKVTSLKFDAGTMDELLAQGYDYELITAYRVYHKLKDLQSSFEKLHSGIYNYALPNEVNRYGDEITPIGFKIDEKENKRVSTSNFNVIGINNRCCDFITIPKGYVIAVADFDQADVVCAYNAYLKSPLLTKIFSFHEDLYAGFYRYCKILKKENPDFKYDEFKAGPRKKFKAVPLARIYGQSSGKDLIQQEYGTTIDKILAQSPKYSQVQRNIKEKESKGYPIVSETYLGFKRTIIAKEGKTIYSTALNAPVQGATSDYACLVTSVLMQKLKNSGLVYGDDFWFYLGRYDEVLIAFKEDKMLNYSWIFKDCSRVMIDDMRPMNVNFEFHYNYKEKSTPEYKAINEVYKESIEKHKHLINFDETPLSRERRDYMAVKAIWKLGLAVTKLDATKYVIVVYDKDNNQHFNAYAEVVSDDYDGEFKQGIIYETSLSGCIELFIEALIKTQYEDVPIYDIVELYVAGALRVDISVRDAVRDITVFTKASVCLQEIKAKAIADGYAYNYRIIKELPTDDISNLDKTIVKVVDGKVNINSKKFVKMNLDKYLEDEEVIEVPVHVEEVEETKGKFFDTDKSPMSKIELL